MSNRGPNRYPYRNRYPNPYPYLYPNPQPNRYGANRIHGAQNKPETSLTLLGETEARHALERERYRVGKNAVFVPPSSW